MPKPATKYFPEENYTELDLVSLSYVSDATEEFGILALMQLVDKASRRNKSLNVTGVLSFDNGRFGQIIEGKPKDVEFEINKLHADVYSDCLMDGYTEDESFELANKATEYLQREYAQL